MLSNISDNSRDMDEKHNSTTLKDWPENVSVVPNMLIKISFNIVYGWSNMVYYNIGKIMGISGVRNFFNLYIVPETVLVLAIF